MKKLTLFFTSLVLFGANGAKDCWADYKDMANQVETVADFWLGGSFNDSSSSINYGLAEGKSAQEVAKRVGSNRASEYYSLKSSGSGGFLVKSAPLPNRYHLEFDYYNDNDWFGDLRYSYKDYLQIRLLPRRLTHNLDNLTVFDFNPDTNVSPAINTNGNDVDTFDARVDDYRVRIDIDEYRLRLKTPNFPLHVYTNGEVIRKKGTQQVRFLGGSGYRATGANRGQIRTSMARDVDQETRTMVLGTNAHLGPLEFDLSHKEREFESDLPTPSYAYDIGIRGLHAIPKLKATTNTIKAHTSHTGRVFASATYSKMDKSNETSGAEAETSLSYGEISWMPVAYFSVGTKFRHQKNDATAPAATVQGENRVVGGSTAYVVKPGIESQTDTAIFTARYSLIPKTSANLQYTWQVKDVEGKSAVALGRPQSTTKDIYEFGLTNWSIPRVRTTVKLSHTRIGNDFGNEVPVGALDPIRYEPVSIDPEHTTQGTLGITWLVSSKVTAFVNGFISKEESISNRLVGSHPTQEVPANSGNFFSLGYHHSKAEALNQQYVLSLNFAVNDKFSISPAYTFMSWEQKRDLVWENSTGVEVVDPEYTNKQKAQNYSLAINLLPTKRLNVNAVVDYTITEGHYDPTSPILLGAVSFNAAEAAEFSRTDTEEFNLRLDSEYDLGRGWGLGLNLRYVDWQDTSTDNPSDGVYYGGLFKVSKKLFY